MIHGGEWDDRGTVWLPDSCTQSVLQNEHARFRTLVGAVSAYSQRFSTQEGVDARLLQQSIPWISHIHKYASKHAPVFGVILRVLLFVEMDSAPQ